jgi:hypothetical protein
MPPPEPLPDQRDQFEVDDAVAYFNAANLSPLLRSVRDAGVIASVRGSSLRIAPHLHNSRGDVRRLLDALGEAAARA